MRAIALHRSLGLLAATLALVHIVAVIATRVGIKPYSTLGWLPEQLLDGRRGGPVHQRVRHAGPFHGELISSGSDRVT